MGLYVNRLDTVTIKGSRSLYIYLLDYGWPDGKWESIFKRHFMKLADLASEHDAVVVGSPRGHHFANSVLSYHRVGDLPSDGLLPAVLVTKTHPDYFKDNDFDVFGENAPKLGMQDLLIIPLEEYFTSEAEFIRSMEGLFSDLRSGKDLCDFEIADGDYRARLMTRGSQLWDSVEIKPGLFGLKLDIKRAFSYHRKARRK